MLSTEMCVSEPRFEFQTVPHEPVSADMCSPNQSDKESYSDISPEPEAAESKW